MQSLVGVRLIYVDEGLEQAVNRSGAACDQAEADDAVAAEQMARTDVEAAGIAIAKADKDLLAAEAC